MKTLRLGMVASLFLSPALWANDHLYPDITDYEKPWISISRFPAAQSTLIKARQGSGKKDVANLRVERYSVGLTRERYDDKYATVSIFYAESKSGEASIITDEEAKLSEQLGFSYASGVHMSGHLDWFLSIEISSGKMEVDEEKKNDVGIGMGTGLMIGMGQHLDIGVSLLATSHYNAGGLSLKANF